MHQTQIHGLQYNLFEECFPDGIPEVLMQRLVNLQSLLIDRPVQNAKQLVKLLEITGLGLDLIRIKNSLLNDEFFDLLPKKCPVIIDLTIEKSAFNPEILLNFKGLKKITVDLELPSRFAEVLFQNNDYLDLLTFQRKGRLVRLYRLPEGKLNLVVANEHGPYLVETIEPKGQAGRSYRL